MLLLFDIDGTLVAGATEAHARALRAALLEVHGVDAREDRAVVSPAGRTDGEIARLLLLDAGVSAARIDERMPDLHEASCREFARICPGDLSHTVIAGIPELLAWLSGLEHVKLSLVTGNYESVARLKLARAGLGRWFPSGQGGFGSDSEDRTVLPQLARLRAGVSGIPHARERTIVIGDTPRDISCARADGVRCLAVSTGPHGAAELSDADWVAADSEQLRSLLASVL